YEYNPKVKGVSTRNDVIYRSGRFFSSFVDYKDDRRNISLERLESMFNNREQSLDYIDEQIAVLEKFRYYGELANVSSGAGALIGMMSSYPKSFIELVDKKRKIDNVAFGLDEEKYKPKIDIDFLVNKSNPNHHPIYTFYYHTLNRYIDKYSQFKLYANPVILKIHEKIAGGAPLSVQEDVMEDFYSYVLTQSK